MSKNVLLDQLRKEQAIREERLRIGGWFDDPKPPTGPYAETLRQVEDQAERLAAKSVPAPSTAPAFAAPALVVDLAPLTVRLDAIEAVLRQRPAPASAPGVDLSALLAVVGDPTDYDGPNHQRMTFCVRVHPEVNAALRRVHRERGLRTLAGAMEWTLRLGLAVIDRAGLAVG
jgi:hypothetical protein